LSSPAVTLSPRTKEVVIDGVVTRFIIECFSQRLHNDHLRSIVRARWLYMNFDKYWRFGVYQR
jgi:hypothetical protein